MPVFSERMFLDTYDLQTRSDGHIFYAILERSRKDEQITAAETINKMKRMRKEEKMDKCILDPERDCLGLHRANEVAGDVRALNQRLDDLRDVTSKSSMAQGARIGELEAHNLVQDEQYSHVREKLADIARDVVDFQRESKGSIQELRKEHKESMEELRKGNREILDAVTPLKHKVESLAHLEEDVEELKEKPGKTWENIKTQAIGWIVAAVLALVAGAMGIIQFIK